MLAKSVSEQNQTPNKNETSNSDCEEEAQYYLQRLQSKPMIDETKELIQLLIEEDSDKYHEDTHEASPPFFRIQKVRSKSDDITYLLDANTPIKVQEDQLFDKY